MKAKKKRALSEEPDALGMALQQHRKKVPKPSEEAPSLYKTDLGTSGLKSYRTGPQPEGSFKVKLTKAEKQRRKERQARFATTETPDEAPDVLSSALSAGRTSKDKAPKKSKSGKKSKNLHTPLVGTSQNLVKQYLRLTDFPKPETVRPLPVLIKSLQLIKRRYIKNEDFDWANEQLKSVRQDITVQGIRNDFVLDVYETHARILLEHGDLNEFNQCQTMLRTLTTGAQPSSSDDDEFKLNKHSGDKTLLRQSEISQDEFAGYRILYALVQKSWTDLTREMAQIRHVVESPVAETESENSSTKTTTTRHAVMVVKALTHNDYHAFFRLYDSAPHLSAYLMDFLVKRVRGSAYERIVAAYRPTISVEHFREKLHFDDLDETREFLRLNGAKFVKEKGEPLFWVDCKGTNGTAR